VVVGQLALVTASLFTGAAIYINVAEQPARLKLDDRALLAEWKPSYKRGFAMQASLAIIGFLFGLIAARAAMDWRWLAGACVMIANWPFTLIAIMPANKLLMEIEPENAGPQSRELMEKWGRLHAVRSMLGAAATVLFLWASLK
jgi:Anthrone oxygenase